MQEVRLCERAAVENNCEGVVPSPLLAKNLGRFTYADPYCTAYRNFFFFFFGFVVCRLCTGKRCFGYFRL